MVTAPETPSAAATRVRSSGLSCVSFPMRRLASFRILHHQEQKLSLTLHVLTVDVGSNGLIGSLPTEIGLLSALEYLYLNYNALTGPLPTQLGTLSSLLVLWLLENNLTGTVPSELGQIPTLRSLDLRNNALTGTIPTEIDLTQVSVLFP